MKKKFKILSTLIALILTAALITGLVSCKSSDKDVLKLATNAAFAPFEYLKKGSDEIVGIDIAIANALAKEMGYSKGIKIENMEFDAIFSTLKKSTDVQMAMAGISVTEERKKTFDFSTPYYDSSIVVIVNKSNTAFDNAKTADDVKNALKKVGVKNLSYPLGQTAGFFIGDSVEDGGLGLQVANAVVFENVPLAAKSLEKKTDQVLITDMATAKATVEATDTLKYINIGLREEKYAIMVKKGNTKMLNKINSALEKLIANGSLKKLIEKELADLSTNLK